MQTFILALKAWNKFFVQAVKAIDVRACMLARPAHHEHEAVHACIVKLNRTVHDWASLH